MKAPVLFIDWDNRRVFCETCEKWIPAIEMLISGKHGNSTHRVWEDAKPVPVAPDSFEASL